MDRLRALEYFVTAADEGSLSKAARKLDVTVPAVAKLVAALEKDLGVALFERSAHGLSLTTAGESYLGSCRPAMQQIHAADEDLRGAGVNPSGTVVIGAQHFVAQSILAPAMPRLHERYPDIQLDFREATQVTHNDAPGVDIFLSLSWPRVPDMIHRAFAISRFIVAAAPSYWRKHGIPRHPNDLLRHNCFQLRTLFGTLMDHWQFERGQESIGVTVKGWMVANNAHRESIIQLARDGHGVIRTLSWSSREDLAKDALEQVLEDWTCSEAPPVTLSYRPSARRIARVKVVIDFVVDVLRTLERETAVTAGVSKTPPHWANVHDKKASTTAGRAKAKRAR